MQENNKYQIINVLVITDSVFDYFYMFLNDSIGRLSSDFIFTTFDSITKLDTVISEASS